MPSQNIYLKTLYHIPPQNSGSKALNLLVEVGDAVLSLLWFDQQNLAVEGVSIHQIEESVDWESALKNYAVLEEIKNCKIFYNTKESLIVPQKYHDTLLNGQLLRLMYGENAAVQIYENYVEKIEAWHIYRIESTIDALLKQTFIASTHHHASVLQLTNPFEGNGLKCIFYQDSFKVLLFKAGALQLVQQFHFNTPEDVVYHLLNCCQQYEMKPTEMKLIISGLMMSDSNLFKLIYSYFLDVVFEVPDENIVLSTEINVFPSHFFSHLIALATCEL